MSDVTDDNVAPRPDSLPLLEGRYRLGERLGRGGMGEVFRARDVRLDRDVAIKVLRDTPSAEPQRFEAEVRTLAGFAHPHLVRVFDAGESNGRAFLVMELIEGSTLAKRLTSAANPSSFVAQIGTGVADALAYVHQKGVIHRDVKPANILLGANDWVWLTDFGIARLIDTTGMTATGISLGTPAYLAPEQIEGGTIGPAADVYALGLVLLECLTGHRAFEGTPAEVTSARLQRPPDIPHGLDAGWRILLRGMTARTPNERPSAGEIASLLGKNTQPADRGSSSRAMLLRTDEEGTQVLPVTDRDQTVAISEYPRTAVFASSRGVQWRARALRIGGPIAAALIVGLVLGAILLGDSRPSNKQASKPPAHHLTAVTTASTIPSTTTSATATSTTTTTTPPSVSSAAGALVAALDADFQNGSVSSQVAQQLVNQIDALLFSPNNAPQLMQSFDQLLQTYDQDVAQGQIDPTTAAALMVDLNTLGSTLGLAASPPVTVPVGPPGHGKHDGR